MKTEFRLLKQLFQKPPSVEVNALPQDGNLRDISKQEKQALQSAGTSLSGIESALRDELSINFERGALYREVDRARAHWMVSSALSLYADVATTFNNLQGASVWVTSENTRYANELNAMLDRIGVEEKIYDWTWSTGLYGDLFPKVNGQPGLGVVSIGDQGHPLNMSRIEYNGVLVGFYNTPMGLNVGDTNSQALIPPWEYVHFRLLGAKRKRPVSDDPQYQEYRTVHLMSPDSRQVDTSYGTSLLNDALAVWKRLRLSEDSIMLTRLTRGILRYIYKVRVDSWNPDAVSEIMDEYVALLKRARSMDSDESGPRYESRFNPLSSIEDIILPYWGEAGDVTIDEVGGKPDIRWITDIDKLENQLASSLRVPIALLGGEVSDATGALGSEAISALDIRFARSARRLQRAIREGIKRICQIHLAYMNMDPDPDLFDVVMGETSSAEETELKDALDTGADIVDKYMDIFHRMAEQHPNMEFDDVEFFNYMNEKILKLNDFDLNDFVKIEREEVQAKEEAKEEGEKEIGGAGGMGDLGVGTPELEEPGEVEEIEGEEPGEGIPGNMAPPDELPVESISKAEIKRKIMHEIAATKKKNLNVRKPVMNLDFGAALPSREKKHGFKGQTINEWKQVYGETKVNVSLTEVIRKK